MDSTVQRMKWRLPKLMSLYGRKVPWSDNAGVQRRWCVGGAVVNKLWGKNYGRIWVLNWSLSHVTKWSFLSPLPLTSSPALRLAHTKQTLTMTKCVILLLILSILHGSSPLGLPLTTAGCCSPSSSPQALIGGRRRSTTNSLPSSSGHRLSASAASTSSDTNNNNNDQQHEENLRQLEQNSKYIMGLISNLEVVLDKWIITGRSGLLN